MKCINCNQSIIIHDNLIPCKEDKYLTYTDKTTRGMIYTEDGLIKYSKEGICEICEL